MTENKDSTLVAHARRELELIGEEADYIDYVCGVVEKFDSYGHSGSSEAITIKTLARLLERKNLSPLTNNPEEWTEVESGSVWVRLWQNNRNSTAFSENKGKNFYLLNDIVDGDRINYTSINYKPKEKSNNMSVKHLPYVSKKDKKDVRVIKVTAKNFQAVAKWSGGLAISKQVDEDTFTNQRVRVGKLMAQIGDYVVRQEVDKGEKAPAYTFFRVKAADFDGLYAKK